MRTGFATSDGLRIRYADRGTGRPVVLVHGWGASARSNWEDTGWVEALLPLRRVVTLDIRGHGDIANPHLTCSMYRDDKATPCEWITPD